MFNDQDLTLWLDRLQENINNQDLEQIETSVDAMLKHLDGQLRRGGKAIRSAWTRTLTVEGTR